MFLSFSNVDKKVFNIRLLIFFNIRKSFSKPVAITFNLDSKGTSRLVSGKVYRLTNHFSFTNSKITSRLNIARYCSSCIRIIGHLRISPNHSCMRLIRFSVDNLIGWTGKQGSFMVCIFYDKIKEKNTFAASFD